MVTQCTACLVWFRVTREQLHAAHGLVRCSACNTVFNALASLRHDIPGNAGAGTPRRMPDETPFAPAAIAADTSAAREESATEEPGDAEPSRAPRELADAANAHDPAAAAESLGPGEMPERPVPSPTGFLGVPSDLLESQEWLHSTEDEAAGAGSGAELRQSSGDARLPASAPPDEPRAKAGDGVRAASATDPGGEEETAETDGADAVAFPEPPPAAGVVRTAAEFAPEGPGERRARPRGRLVWVAVLVLAALILAGQIVYAERGPLGSLLGWSGPPLELSRYTITDATLDSSPGATDALVLKGTLLNQADHAQRFPLIRVTLTDRYGDAVGARTLTPADYGADANGPLPGHRRFMFHVKLADPGSSAVGFSLVLCKRRGQSVLCEAS